MFVFTETMEWLQPEVLGDLPSPRGLHTTTLVGDRLLVFGGSSSFNTETMSCGDFHNDMYSISTGENKSLSQ